MSSEEQLGKYADLNSDSCIFYISHGLVGFLLTVGYESDSENDTSKCTLWRILGFDIDVLVQVSFVDNLQESERFLRSFRSLPKV